MTLSPKRADIGIGTIEVEAEILGEGEIVGANLVEHRLVEADQIDLVDGQNDAPDAKQRGDDRVAARLRQDTLARIHQHDGEIGRRGAGRHVAGVLNMAGRIGDDEFALRRGEKPIGDVDGNALLALGLQPIDQKGEVDVLAGRAMLLGVALERCELVLEDQLGVVEQPADQCRLAIIDRAAGQKAQQRLLALLSEIGTYVVGLFRDHGVGVYLQHDQK